MDHITAVHAALIILISLKMLVGLNISEDGTDDTLSDLLANETTIDSYKKSDGETEFKSIRNDARMYPARILIPTVTMIIFFCGVAAIFVHNYRHILELKTAALLSPDKPQSSAEEQQSSVHVNTASMSKGPAKSSSRLMLRRTSEYTDGYALKVDKSVVSYSYPSSEFEWKLSSPESEISPTMDSSVDARKPKPAPRRRVKMP